jgi:phosphotransferase system HPr (HPr) family protein
MSLSYAEARNIVFHKPGLPVGSCPYEGGKQMSRTIEAIMRHMASPSSRTTNQTNGTGKLEKDVTVKKQRYVWSEARFVRTIARFRCDVRVTYNGKEVNGKNVLDLITLDPPEGSTVKIRAEGPDAAEAIHAVEQMIQLRSED